MRIGMVAPPWLPVPPHGYGGTEVVVDRLCRALHRAGHDVRLVANPESTCPVPTRSVLASLDGVLMGSGIHEGRHVLGAYAMLDGWAEVVHDHTILGPVMGAPSMRHPVPVVVTNHGPFTDVTAPVFAVLAGRAGVLAISHEQARLGRALGVPIAGVVHHGLDVDEVPVGAGDGGYAVFLGRMNPDKGVHVAIDAARRAGVPLRIAAKMREPAEFAYFDDAVRPLLGPGVEFLGEVHGDDKQALLGRAVALVNPIRWAEPFGMVMIEALATGTPVLTCPHGAAPEIVDDGRTGFLCDSTATMAARLRALATTPALADEMRVRCRAAVRARFSADAMAAGYVACYRHAVARGPAPRHVPAVRMRALSAPVP